MSEYNDRLMEQLLREVLGGDRPRDMTERVMVRARGYDKVRRHWWVGTAASVAASVAIVVALWSFWPQRYPEPVIDDGHLVLMGGGDTVQRGSLLVTEEEPATVKLGGYVRVDMEPQTEMTLGGSKFEEKILLARGNVDVAVTKKKGTFDVLVGSATVHVTGTQFRVGVEEQTLPKGHVKNLLVAVKEGSVVVGGVEGEPPVTLTAASPPTRFQISFAPTTVGRLGRVSGLLGGAASGARSGGAPGLAGQIINGGTAPQPRNNYPPLNPLPSISETSPMPSPAFGAIQMITKAGSVIETGKLMMEGGIYVLQTDDNGPILLFSQQAPLDHMPSTGRRVRVTWENRKVTGVQEMSAQ